MPRFIRSVIVQAQTPAADGIYTHDLPVNPLTLLLIHLSPLNECTTLTNYVIEHGLVAAINALDVLFQGQTIVHGNGQDLHALNALRRGIQPWQQNLVDTDDDYRSVVLPIFFSRKLADPDECFPATRKGELQLRLDLDIADTGYDALTYTVEAIELPEATPTHFERVTTLTQTLAALGVNDVDLPLGNLYRGLLLFGTTGYAGAAPAPSWGRLTTLLNNAEHGISSTDWEVLAGMPGHNVGFYPAVNQHVHNVNVPASTDTDSALADQHTNKFEHYAFIDWDLTDDDTYSVTTEGASRFHIRADAETADLVRVLPVEQVPVAELPGR